MTTIDLLAPSHLLSLWRSDGLSPQEVRAKSDAWIAENLQYKKPPSLNGFKVLRIPAYVKQGKRQGRPPRSPASNPKLDPRTCKRCLITYTVGEGFRSPKSKICNFCKEASEQREPGKRGPKMGSRYPQFSQSVGARIEAIGLDILRQECQELGVTAVDRKYHFHSGTMRVLFPDIQIQQKLPDNATLTELAKDHTLKEIAKIYGCSIERVRQRLKSLGGRAASPVELRIRRAGGIETLREEALADGIDAVAKRTGVSYKYLKGLLPKILRKPFPNEKRKIPSPERLRELYQTHTAKEIAEMCGSTKGAVFQAIHRAGITKRYPSIIDVHQELLDIAKEFGRPTVMPKVREFIEHGKKTLLNRIGYLGGLQVLADETGLSMQGRRYLPPVEVLTKMLEGRSVGEVAKELGVSEAGVYGKLRRNRNGT